MGSISPKLIRSARHYSDGSTVDLRLAAMATVAGPIYGLIIQSKGRVSISGGWRSLRGCVSSTKTPGSSGSAVVGRLARGGRRCAAWRRLGLDERRPGRLQDFMTKVLV